MNRQKESCSHGLQDSFGIYSILLDDDFLAILDVDTLAGIHDLHTLQVVHLACSAGSIHLMDTNGGGNRELGGLERSSCGELRECRVQHLDIHLLALLNKERDDTAVNAVVGVTT